MKEQDCARYLVVAEELNFALMEIVEHAGARLALLSQEPYLDHGENRAGGAAGTGESIVDDRGETFAKKDH